MTLLAFAVTFHYSAISVANYRELTLSTYSETLVFESSCYYFYGHMQRIFVHFLSNGTR